MEQIYVNLIFYLFFFPLLSWTHILALISLSRILLPNELWVPPSSRLELQPKCAEDPPRFRCSSKNPIPAGWNRSSELQPARIQNNRKKRARFGIFSAMSRRRYGWNAGERISTGWNQLKSAESAEFCQKNPPAGMRRNRLEYQPDPPPTHLSEGPITRTCMWKLFLPDP